MLDRSETMLFLDHPDAAGEYPGSFKLGNYFATRLLFVEKSG